MKKVFYLILVATVFVALGFYGCGTLQLENTKINNDEVESQNNDKISSKKENVEIESQDKYKDYEEELSVIGDIIEIGLYQQESDTSNDKEVIKWIVLDTDGNRYLLCSLYILDNQSYNETTIATSATWESCSLRVWLNDTFINEVFTQEQQSAIMLTTVENDENTTQDKIFLLSYDEAWHYFSDESLRQAAGTAYAIANKLSVSKKTGIMSSWWLRTPESSLYKFVVNPIGRHENSPRVNERQGVRPALWIDLDLLNNNS